MTSNICAPNRYDKQNNTCFSLDQLLQMAAAYNRYIVKTNLDPQRKNINSELIQIKPNKKYLLSEFKNRFDKICGNNEICLTRQSFMNEIVGEVREDITEHTFRHNGPSDSSEWLSTTDINNIMKQYEKVYSDFVFVGAVPLDCGDLDFCQVSQIDYDHFQKAGIKKIGIIFNLDRHGQPGSHWVSFYIDLNVPEVNYCDSNGKSASEPIVNVIRKLNNYCYRKLKKNPIYKFNTLSYQKDNSECGIYSCNFIIRRLAGESFEEVVNQSLDFNQIKSCRNVYFRNGPNLKAHDKCDPKI